MTDVFLKLRHYDLNLLNGHKNVMQGKNLWTGDLPLDMFELSHSNSGKAGGLIVNRSNLNISPKSLLSKKNQKKAFIMDKDLSSLNR